QEMVGLTDADLFDAAHAEFALTEEQQILATGEPTAYKEVRETWTDRPDTWAYTTKRPLRSADGTIIGIVGISQDVTRRVEAEHQAELAMARLRAIEESVRGILDSSPDAVLRLDPNLRISYANAAAEGLLGRQAQDVAGVLLADVGLEPG